MLRRALLLAVLLAWSPAGADQRTVPDAVRTHVAKLAQLADDEELALAPGAIVIDAQGSTVDLSQEDGCVSGAVANAFYGCLQADIAHKLGVITQGSDPARGVAWFQAPYTATFTGYDDDPPSKQARRVGGVLIKRGDGWELAAVMHVEPISDKQLVKRTTDAAAPASPALAGDPALSKAVASWFATGFVGAAAKGPTLIASGTSPSEYKSGAGALKLAKTWDALKLAPVRIDARVLAKGAIGWVLVDVQLPARKGRKAVPMKLAIVVIPDGTGWRWVSLQYQPDFQV